MRKVNLPEAQMIPCSDVDEPYLQPNRNTLRRHEQILHHLKNKIDNQTKWQIYFVLKFVELSEWMHQILILILTYIYASKYCVP